jgi:uncharacterized RDD family membrane protein YckC
MASAASYTPPGDPTEVLGRRAIALLIDAALLFVIGITLFALLRYRAYTDVNVDICSRLSKSDGQPICLKIGTRAFLWHRGALKLSVLVVLFLGFLDGVVLQSITGSTVGKYCTRLSVVDERGLKAHPLRMFGRWVMLVIDLGFILVGCIITGATHPHRRLGDFVFGTYVVSMSSVGRPIDDWIQGGVGASGNSMPSLGEPASWTVPPVPVPTGAAALSEPAPLPTPPPPPLMPPRVAPMVAAVETPPGTAPTTPGEWGAVARPAPLVRSPQWATPPPSDEPAPPIVATPGPTPWASPPARRETEDGPADGPDADAVEEVESEVEPASEAASEADTDDASETETKVKADTTAAAGAEKDAKKANDAKPAAKAGAKAKNSSQPDVELELEAELGDENESTSQWKPVESASARSRPNSAAGPADDSWWEEALSSGESENGTDPSKSE